MAKFLVQNSASFRIDEIYRYTQLKWGEEKAKEYIEGMFSTFSGIDKNECFSMPIPSEFGHSGFYYCYKKHFIYWKYLESGHIGIVTILHQRMHQGKQFSKLHQKGRSQKPQKPLNKKKI